MVEMTTGQRPFNDYTFDGNLAVMICYFGLRPKFALGTPDCYIELANQCMNSDPEKRPNISEIIIKLEAWFNISENKNESIREIIFNKWLSITGGKSDVIKNKSEIIKYVDDIIKNNSESRIKKQFSESDEVNKNLPKITEKLNNIYTSKPYFISEIGERLSKIYTTKPVDVIEVPDDY
ncbi:hypothetical protein C2G38_2006648 [Gigaspora rosea]|uniref:Protein kinase domain-containing protein n=1 Tax=Gigaspora rosea TaxID=44941 RepID=A0A397UBP4_9GLOM|nr:hypothetical protein C2G38_2006648 [Gigaspora rosea]